jgi:hypothetical protein
MAVLDTQVPFDPLRGERLAAPLCDALREAGHEVVAVRIPFSPADPRRVVDQILAARLIHLENAERVIGLTFPAYLVPHDDKLVWIAGEPPEAAGAAAQAATVRTADGVHLAAARRLYSRSDAAAALLEQRSGLPSAVLLPPLREPELFRCEEYGDDVVAIPSSPADRWPLLLVAAMSLVAGPARCVVAAAASGPAGAPALAALAAGLGATGRVEVVAAPLDAAARARLLAGCRAAVCWSDDPCPRAMLEAFRSCKPVIALATPGGAAPPEAGLLGGDGSSCRRAASVAELAAAIDELSGDSDLARRRGSAAAARLAGLDVSWAAVVRELTR